MPRYTVDLQWGRGGEAAERRCAVLLGPGGGAAFNGAAAVRPRKVSRRFGLGGRPKAFNGAAAVRPRKARPRSKPRSQSEPFTMGPRR